MSAPSTEPTVALPAQRMTVSALRALCDEAERAATPVPVEGQEYARNDMPPTWASAQGNVWRYVSGTWEFNHAFGAQRDWCRDYSGACYWSEGRLSPYTPPAPARLTPRVGTLVRREADGAVLRVWFASPEVGLDYLNVTGRSTEYVRPTAFTADAYTPLARYTVEGVV